MFVRIFLFFIGFGLTTIGLVYIICYLNLISFGYNFYDYVKFIISRAECLITLIGIILIYLSIMLGGNYELHL